MGIPTRWSAASSHASESPGPSAPNSIATRSGQSTTSIGVAPADGVSANVVKPARRTSSTDAIRVHGNRSTWPIDTRRSEEHTSELQSHVNLVCRLLLEKKKTNHQPTLSTPHT